MMRGLIYLALLLMWPVTSQAKSVDLPDIRPIETGSTDVFETLQRLAQADAELAERDYLAAKRGYESVLMHDPKLTSARAGLRRSLIALGDITQAAQLIDDPNSADALLIRILSGASETPLDDLKTGLKTHQDPRLWNAMGRLQDKTGDHATARQSYAMAGFYDQRVGLAENNIGHSFLLEQNLDAALEAFTRAVTADPADLRFDNNRRRTLVMLGQTKAALAGLGSNRAALFLNQAGDHARQNGETRLARFLYQKSLELTPRHHPETARKLDALQ